jgi:hypothetical protein
MFCKTVLFAAALVAAAPALAGEAEITLKAGAASMALALADADPVGGWVAVNADPEPAAAKAKADILIESLEDGTLTLGYDPALLRDVPWGDDAAGYAIFAVDTASVGAGAETGVTEVLAAREAAVLLTRGLTWSQAAADHLAYLVLNEADGSAALVLPATELGLTGVEPDEID